MAQLVYRFFCWLILFFPLTAWATHQVGGQLEMQAVGDVPGHFRILVINYFEDNSRAATITAGVVGIYRKRDNALMTSFTVTEVGRRSPVIYANAFCATQRNLKFIAATFSSDIYLLPGQYTDSQGYYISHQTRNRNAGINNLNNPARAGFTFYLEFPALTTTGKFINNSSPQFPLANGEYVCLNEPFTYAFGGTDPDGDELRHSLVAPLDQRVNNGVSPGPYPKVGYASGYSEANSIPGNPPLRVDAQTGRLSVTASEVGLFVYSVQVDEYRNGQKIGEVRRDFQLLVVDCPKNAQAPDPAVRFDNLPLTTTKTTLCPGESAMLLAVSNPDWNYQWQRDGANLANANSSSLVVTEQGEYTVNVSLKKACAKASGTQSLTVNSFNTKPLLTATGQLCATYGQATLNLSDVPDVMYLWTRDGQPLAGEVSATLLTELPGLYQATLTHRTLGCAMRSDQLRLARAPAVLATLRTGSGISRICPNEPLDLLGDGGILYSWGQQGVPIPDQTGSRLVASVAGTYSLTVTDANGCRGTAALLLTAVPPVLPTLDSLPPFCGTAAAPHLLAGTPAGGTYGGPGTSPGLFTPAQAGLGQHSVTYSVRPALECAAVVARRTAAVYVIPTVQLPTEILTFRGNTLTLEPILTGDPIWFRWTPAEGLKNPQTAVVQIESIQESTDYQLMVTNAGGCPASATVQVTVIRGLYVPDAFTPNGDGENDDWRLTNIAAYPAVDVTVFNRWGTAVFHAIGPDQTAFDGRLNGVDLPGGVYTYVIRPAPAFPTMQGRLLLVR